MLLSGLSPGNSRSLAGGRAWAQPADGSSPSSPGTLLCVPIRIPGTRASSNGRGVSKLSHQASPVSSPPVPSEQATSCCLPHCPPFVPLEDGKSGRCPHPARADGHEAGDLAPQGPLAARLSSCSAPLSGPVLRSLQVLQSAWGRCSWAIKPRGQAVRGGSCLPAEKQEIHLRGKVEEQLPWAARYRSGGLALAGARTKISPGFYWRPFSSLGEPSILSSAGWVAAHTNASVGEEKRPGEGEADHREGNRGLWA